MPGTAAKIFFSERQMEMLEEIVASKTASVRLVERAQIVLLAYQKRNNQQIGEIVGLNPQQVSVWRRRTPKHCSWLNQIEIWFGVLRRKLTRYGSFVSLTNLSDRIKQFIGYYNNTMARPYRWTCDGKLLCK